MLTCVHLPPPPRSQPSQYGTFVNGKRVDGIVPLNHGDSLLFGVKEASYLYVCCPVLPP